RHQHGVGHRYQADESEQEEEGPDRRTVGHEVKSLLHVGQDGAGWNVLSGRDGHHKQADYDRYVTHRVGEETPAFADIGDQNPSDRRSNDASAVEHGRVQSDGIDQVFFSNHLDQKGLPSGDVERVYDSQEYRQGKAFMNGNSIR